MITNPSEFERNKPTETYKKIRKLQNMITLERQKTETLYSNRIAMLDQMQKSVIDLMDSFKKGE